MAPIGDPSKQTNVAASPPRLMLGALIGLEPQIRQRAAGLHTNSLRRLGAAAFVDLPGIKYGSVIQVITHLVSGVRFLGVGGDHERRGDMRGLNTAGPLWCSAAVGGAPVPV